MRERCLAALIAAVCAGLLYLPWLSVQFDLNGIGEAAQIESGVLTPNHLLFRPLGAAILHVARAAGYDGLSVRPLQVVSALCGALAAGCAMLAFRRLGAPVSSAAMAVTWVAASWAHWVASTDVDYVTLAVMLAAAALTIVAVPAASPGRAAGAGFVAALSTLAWQANVFVFPALALGLGRAADWPARRRSLLIFLASGGATLVIGFLTAAAVSGALSSPAAFVRWSTSYHGQPLPHWGVWGADRLGAAASTWVASVVSVWDGLGLRALWHGVVRPDKLLPQLSLAALVALVGLTAARLIRHGPRAFVIGWMLAAFALYLPFIVWWEPFSPRWFMVPNLFLAALLAVVWRHRSGPAWFCVVVIGLANFSAAVWPRHTRPNPLLARAACAVAHLAPADVILVSDWEWFGYATYFYGYRGRYDWLIDRRGRERKLADIDRQIDEADRRGGRVVMLDVRDYPAARADWLREQTELTVDDFGAFAPRPAFTCGDASFVALHRRYPAGARLPTVTPAGTSRSARRARRARSGARARSSRLRETPPARAPDRRSRT